MLFEKRQRLLNRLLIVEDEPLTAFDNEHQLGEAGYEIVSTVDRVADAVRVIETEPLDLVLVDLRLSDGEGTDVAVAAKQRGVPVLFVSGACPPDAGEMAIGCLDKPYSPRDLVRAIEAVEARLSGKRPRQPPPGLTLFAWRDS